MRDDDGEVGRRRVVSLDNDDRALHSQFTTGWLPQIREPNFPTLGLRHAQSSLGAYRSPFSIS